jgi:cysteinyl-tRNA synthetase
MADLRWQLYDTAPDMTQDLQVSHQAILKALQQDLGTPQALALLSNIEQQLITHGVAPSSKKALTEFLDFTDRLFGLKLTQSTDITNDQKQLIEKREQARAKKDWTTSDTLRDQLQAQGLSLRDTAQGAYWYRT